jgi:hypothetical protein
LINIGLQILGVMFSDFFEVMAVFSHWKEGEMVTWIDKNLQKTHVRNAEEVERRLAAGERPVLPTEFQLNKDVWIKKLLTRREKWKNTWRMPWVSVVFDCRMHALTDHSMLLQSAVNPNTLNAALMKEVDTVAHHMNLVGCPCIPVCFPTLLLTLSLAGCHGHGAWGLEFSHENSCSDCT